MTTAESWREQAIALRAQQRMIEADEAIAQARLAAPADPLIAFLQAQSRYELGHPAADLFAQACRLWPANLDARRNHALALTGEGDQAQAEALLEAALGQHPDWLDGHKVLASLRYTGGQAGFDASYAVATQAHPHHAGLWLGWFSAVAQIRDWLAAQAILEAAARHLGETRALLSARLFLAGESGDTATIDRLLAATAGWQDDFLQMARIRQHLRRRDAASALAVALPLTATRMAGQVWPYVSTCWRLLGDGRAAWLDGDPAYVAMYDIGLSAPELAELAQVLRGLHRAQRPYAEQSVRGGTQTDRSVLLRHEPILQRARAALMQAVRHYVDELPPHDRAHPLLSVPRGNLSIGGSWSVRLTQGGFNVAHAHPMGWISSAFYVTLPDAMGPPPAGHFHYGAPPVELGLDLSPIATMSPVAGHVILFPSTLWHGTHPVAGAERMNIAFDVVAR